MHEHTGDCCGQHEHTVHEHLHEAAEHMGRLCCAGACQHPEHQFIQAQFDQELMRQQLNENPVAEPIVEKKKSKKKKKRSASFLLDQLVAKGRLVCAPRRVWHNKEAMLPIILSIGTFFSTLTGGIVGLRNKDRLHRFLGYTAGVLMGVVAFDLLPEIFKSLQAQHHSATGAMIALVCGFLLFHIIEKSILIHHTQEDEYEVHHHPHVGIASALALSGHSFLDGVGIGLGFQAGHAVGIAVAIAVIAHDFTDA